MNSIVVFPKDYQVSPETDHRMTRSFISPHTVVAEFDPYERVEKAAESLLTLRYEGTKIEPSL